jgi:hypothetical protein
VYRLQRALGVVTDGTGCAVAGEECCRVSSAEAFVRVWSLATTPSAPSNDSLLTASAEERASLLASGAWTEIGAPWFQVPDGGATGMATNASAPWADRAWDNAYSSAARGPFLLYANASTDVPGTAPLYRCVHVAAGGAQQHFVSSDIGCGGQGTVDSVLGRAGVGRTGLTAREVRRCRVGGSGGTAGWYSAVNAPCADGDTDEGVQGYGI